MSLAEPQHVRVEQQLPRLPHRPRIEAPVLGAPDVGMLSLIDRLCNNRQPEYEHPIEEYSRSTDLQYRGYSVILELIRRPYDPCGHSGLPPRAIKEVLRRSEACVLVYDVSNRDSLSCVEALYQLLCEVQPQLRDGHTKAVSPARRLRRVAIARFISKLLRRRAGEQDSTPQYKPPFPLVIVANKLDKPRATWAVSLEEGMQLSRRMGGVFYAVSAWEGSGCDKAILDGIVESVLQRWEPPAQAERSTTIAG